MTNLARRAWAKPIGASVALVFAVGVALGVASPPAAAQSLAIEIEAAFAPSSIPLDGTTTLTVTVTNPNPFSVSGIAFSNTYPAGLVPQQVGPYTCSAGGGAVFNGSGWALNNVTLGAGQSCEVPMIVKATVLGTIVDTTSQVTGTGTPPGGPATASLLVRTATATAVQSSKNPTVVGEQVTFTAIVSTVPPGAGTPTGTVTFLDGGTPIGTGTVSDGKATLATPTLTVGNHTITAAYGGDASFNASTGSLSGNTQLVSGPPGVSIASPVSGASFALGQVVAADYACSEAAGGPGIDSCAGPVAPGAAIDTSHAGVFTFTVTATSRDGLTATATATFTVVAATPPSCLGKTTEIIELRRTGRRVRITGVTLPRFAGKPVTITAVPGGQTLGTGAVNPDGTFAVSVRPASGGARVRYRATVQGHASRALAIDRHLQVTITPRATHVRVRLKASSGLARSAPVTLYHQLTCGKRTVDRRMTLRRSGKLTIDIPRPGPGEIAFYRVVASVLPAGAHRRFETYSVPIVVSGLSARK